MERTFRVIFAIDPCPDLHTPAGHPLPETREAYEKDPYIKNGSVVPFEDYLAYQGNPDRHLVIVCKIEEHCPTCRCWVEKASADNIDFMDDDGVKTGTFLPEELGNLVDAQRGIAVGLLREAEETRWVDLP